MTSARPSFDGWSRKPPCRTRERILETALRLYNALGEPNTSVQAIADAVGISPGNLHYHFRSRDDLTGGLVEQFAREIEPLLDALDARPQDVTHAWQRVHALFEMAWRYRFLYRDMNGLLWRHRAIEARLRAVLARKVRAVRALCDGLAEAGALRAGQAEREALAVNVVVVATWWLSLETVCNPRGLEQPAEQAAAVARGTRQVFMMIAPHLADPVRDAFGQLAGVPQPPRRTASPDA